MESFIFFIFLILQSQLHHFHHLLHGQSEHEHSSSPLSTRTAAAEVISVHFTPGNAKIAACYLHFCGFQLSEIRMISLVGLNQTVGHNYVVFPSISPSKLSLLRQVSFATELSRAPVCVIVRVCAYAWMSKYTTPHLLVKGVCHIQVSVTHQGLQQSEGELRPHPAHNINGGRCFAALAQQHNDDTVEPLVAAASPSQS